MVGCGHRKEADERRQHHEQWFDGSRKKERGKRHEDREVVPHNYYWRKVQPQRRNEQRHRDQTQIQQRRLARDEIGGNERADDDQRAQQLAGLDFAGEEIAQAHGGRDGWGVHRAPDGRRGTTYGTEGRQHFSVWSDSRATLSLSSTDFKPGHDTIVAAARVNPHR